MELTFGLSVRPRMQSGPCCLTSTLPTPRGSGPDGNVKPIQALALPRATFDTVTITSGLRGSGAARIGSPTLQGYQTRYIYPLLLSSLSSSSRSSSRDCSRAGS